MTIGDLFEFIKLNKGQNTFIGMDDDFILSCVKWHIENEILLYSTDKDNKVNGMLLAEKRGEDVIFIGENLALTLSNLKKFAAIAKKNWPTRRLEWIKNGIYKMHNTERFYNKLAI